VSRITLPRVAPLKYLPSVRLPPLLTLPNVITLARLPLAVLFLFANTVAERLVILGMASASDFVDGWLARRFRRTTKSGALLDPIADKTFVLAALTAFVPAGALSTSEYFVILSRDFATAIGFLVAWRLPGLDPHDFKARMPGKVVTVLQLAAILALTIEPRAMRWLVPIIGVASAISIIDYTLVLHRTRQR
jgi:CDP-diacylglycerol--glycerol-3-phosphate 3-phosphatidyltransferase/cardiolipin synthase